MQLVIYTYRVAETYVEIGGIHDECGIAVATSVGGDYFAPIGAKTAFKLNHRGYQAAGMLLASESEDIVLKGFGDAAHALPPEYWAGYLDQQFTTLIVHDRYATNGSASYDEIQPAQFVDEKTGLRVTSIHNGNFINTEAVGEDYGIDPSRHGSDSVRLGATVLASMVQQRQQYGEKVAGQELELAVEEVMPQLNGAGSLAFFDGERVVVYRDKHGFRPLVLGRRKDGWAVASESCAMPTLGARLVRDVAPGELLTIEGDRLMHKELFSPVERMCYMEFAYLMRPNSTVRGVEIDGIRQKMGEELAAQHRIDADVVIGVPQSGVPAALGYARASQIPYERGFIVNDRAGRSFIIPGQEARREKVRDKLDPIIGDVKGKRLIVVDDSLVRSTTSREIILMLREAGAVEVNFLLTSPPYKWPCFYGLDTGTRAELIAADKSVEQIRRYIGADRLLYLDLERGVQAIGEAATGLCTACFTKDYPTDIPDQLIYPDRT